METTKQDTYNGWTNYATWGVALVLDNDQGTQEHVQILAGDAREEAKASSQVAEGIWTVKEAARYGLAAVLKDFVEELCGLGDEFEIPEPTLMARQVLQAGLAEVDWDDIARNILSDYSDEER